MDTDNLSPEGALIEAARERAGLSQNAAAAEAGITGTHWRTIVRGGVAMTSPRGVNTLARMAAVVGVAPDELRDAGRPDIAERLQLTLPPDEGPLSDAEIDQMAAEALEILDRLRSRIADDRKQAQMETATQIVRWVVEKPTTGVDN